MSNSDKLREVVSRQSASAKNPLATTQQMLHQHQDQLRMALPKHLNADRMIRLTLTAFSQNPALANCDPKSVFGAVVTASQLGLEIGVLGQAYLVPYKGRATLVPGWQGICDLVNRSGRASVWTGAVFVGDEFEYAFGSSPEIKHRPKGEDDPKLLEYTYAVGRVNGCEWPVIEVWDKRRLERHRDRYNKVGSRHYSYENWEMYARKVPLLQVCKYMPKSIELTNAIQASHAAEAGTGFTFDGEIITPEADTAAADPAPAEKADKGKDDFLEGYDKEPAKN